MNIADIQFMCFIPVSEKVISSVCLQQILQGGYYREILLVITEFNLHFFIKNNPQTGYEVIACHPYNKLFIIDYIDSFTFRLVFSTNNSNTNLYDGKDIITYTLIKENPLSIIDIIYKTAIMTLPKQNYLRINQTVKENFIRNEEDSFYPYQVFMHRNLQTIDLHGSIRVTFSDMLPRLLRWLKKSKSVTQIDVSKNKLNEKCITSLSDLITTNQRISQVLIGDLNISDYTELIPLINAIKSRKDQIYIQFPEETFSLLKEKGQIDGQNLNNARELFENPFDQCCSLHWQMLIDQRYPEWPKINEVIGDVTNNISNSGSKNFLSKIQINKTTKNSIE